MKAFVTFNQLREIGNRVADKRAFLEAHAANKIYNVFLSHASADDELLSGVIRILENHGAVVYIDDGDDRLPEKTTPETARVLKDSINDCHRFVLFVTPNSKGSRWIPWELGLGDGMKTSFAVALFPSAETWNETEWSEQEYLGLYQRIIWATFKGKEDPEWMVLNHHDNTATPLRKWLEG